MNLKWRQLLILQTIQATIFEDFKDNFIPCRLSTPIWIYIMRLKVNGRKPQELHSLIVNVPWLSVVGTWLGGGFSLYVQDFGRTTFFNDATFFTTQPPDKLVKFKKRDVSHCVRAMNSSFIPYVRAMRSRLLCWNCKLFGVDLLQRLYLVFSRLTKRWKLLTLFLYKLVSYLKIFAELNNTIQLFKHFQSHNLWNMTLLCIYITFLTR